MDPAQRLRQLDRSSAQFPKQLNELLYDKEWIDRLVHLPEGELIETIGNLDDVRFISTR